MNKFLRSEGTNKFVCDVYGFTVISTVCVVCGYIEVLEMLGVLEKVLRQWMYEAG